MNSSPKAVSKLDYQWPHLTPKMPMSKLKAFLLHLLLSACLAATLVGGFIFFWYPLPYFVADGGWQGLRTVVAVDVVLGPLLTLVVYNRKKARRALIFDYTVIALLQCAALALGLWTVSAHRTLLVVFTDGAFFTVEAETASLLGENARSIVRSATKPPAYAVLRMPESEGARQTLRRQALATGTPLYTQDDLLAPLDKSSWEHILSYQDTFREALADPRNQREIQGFLAKAGGTRNDYLFVRLLCRYQPITLILDRSSKTIRGWLKGHARSRGPAS